ncbi:MAG: hypothetical protein J2P23_04035 [Microlunatus sp.]|nr:hypothetical protein [Microlunatus sp.]
MISVHVYRLGVIDKITLSAPVSIMVGRSADVSATGGTTGFGLMFPLRFPASVVWSGSTGLVIAETAAAVAQAMAAPKTLAVLDLRVSRITAVRPGKVDLRISSGGLTEVAAVSLV